MSAYGDDGLGLLGHPMRRAIFEMLARRPSSVGEIGGSGEALLMAIAGRANATDELTGAGVATLARVMSR